MSNDIWQTIGRISGVSEAAYRYGGVSDERLSQSGGLLAGAGTAARIAGNISGNYDLSYQGGQYERFGQDISRYHDQNIRDREQWERQQADRARSEAQYNQGGFRGGDPMGDTIQRIEPLVAPLRGLAQATTAADRTAALNAYIAAASQLPNGLDTQIPVSSNGHPVLVDFSSMGGAAVRTPQDGTITPRELVNAAFANNPPLQAAIGQRLAGAPATGPAPSGPAQTPPTVQPAAPTVTHTPVGAAVNMDDPAFNARPAGQRGIDLINAPSVTRGGQPVSPAERLNTAITLTREGIAALPANDPNAPTPLSTLFPIANGAANNMMALYAQSSEADRAQIRENVNHLFNEAETKFPHLSVEIQAQQDSFNQRLGGAVAPAQPQTGVTPEAPAGTTPPAPPAASTEFPAAAAGAGRAPAFGVRAQTRPAADSMPVIAPNQVQAIQERLIAAGHPVGTMGADGKYGPNTHAGMLAYGATLTPPITNLATLDFTNPNPETQRFMAGLAPRTVAPQAPVVETPAPVVATPQPQPQPPAPPAIEIPNVGIYDPRNTAGLPQEGGRESRHGLAERGLRELGELSNGINLGLFELGAEKVDGRPGSVSTGAIRRFQEENHLPVTGVADPITLQVIGIKIAAQNGTYDGMDPRRPVPQPIVDAVVMANTRALTPAEAQRISAETGLNIAGAADPRTGVTVQQGDPTMQAALAGSGVTLAQGVTGGIDPRLGGDAPPVQSGGVAVQQGGPGLQFS